MKRRSFLGRVLACVAIPFVGFRREEKPEVFLIDLGDYPSIEIHLYKLRTEVWCDGVAWTESCDPRDWMIYKGHSAKWWGAIRLRRDDFGIIDISWFAVCDNEKAFSRFDVPLNRSTKWENRTFAYSEEAKAAFWSSWNKRKT